MIHTCDIRCRISEYTYLNILSQYGESPSLNTWQTDAFAGEGVTSISLFRMQGDNISFCSIMACINPDFVVSGRYDPLALFHSSRYSDLVRRFDEIMQDFTPETLPSLSHWRAERIDVAYDVIIPSQDSSWATPLTYIDLARRGSRPGSLIEDRPDWISYRDETNSVTLNFYQRGPALRSRGIKFSDEILVQADQTLRFEVQLEKPKLKYIAQRNGFQGRELPRFMDEALHNSQLEYYAKRVVGIDDYYSVSRAANILSRSPDVRSDVANNLIHFLKAVESAGGLYSARNRWSQNRSVPIFDRDPACTQVRLSLNQYYQRLKRLRGVRINAVPIPRNMALITATNPLIDFWRMTGHRV